MKNVGAINAEFQHRAQSIGLRYEVGADGSIDADTAIIGEGVGEREIALKLPFIGGAGRKLFDAFSKHGYLRRNFYITNVVKRQLSFDRKSEVTEKVPANEFAHWAGLLKWELSQLPKLKTVILCGNAAMRALLQEEGIMKWRGSVIVRDGIHYVCLFNPAFTIDSPMFDPIYRLDIDRAVRTMRGEFREHRITAEHSFTYAGAVARVRHLHASALRTGVPVAFDIETISGETACIGFADNAHSGFCINFRDRDHDLYSVAEERVIRTTIARLLADKRVRLVAQNGNFDCYWLWYKDRIRAAPLWFDTMLAHHTMFSPWPHNLAFLTTQYTTHPFYKDDAKDWREGGDISSFWDYNVKDVCITWEVARKQMIELKQLGLDKFFFEEVMSMQPELTRMTVTGILNDTSMRDSLHKELSATLEQKREAFKEAARKALIASGNYMPDQVPDVHINPNSAHQLKKLFFLDLKLTGRGTSTDELNRSRILSHPKTTPQAAAMIMALNSYVADHKFFSNSVDLVVDTDNRVRCEYKQTGVARAPGRLSSAQTMWGSGTNLQNQPEKAKILYIADPGYCFIYFDKSQAEARIVAYKWGVKALIENFERAGKGGFDVHRANAARIFRVPYETVPTKDWNDDGTPTLRYLGKRCVHGLNYRMMPDRLATSCNIPIHQAEDAHRRYHMAFPEIMPAWKEIINEFTLKRKLVNAFGRVLPLLGRPNESSFDSIIAFYPQSTIGDHVKRIIRKAHNDPEWDTNEAQCLLNIHDANVAMVPDSDDARRHYTKILKKYSDEPIIINGAPIVIPSDFKWSKLHEVQHRWSHMEKVTI